MQVTLKNGIKIGDERECRLTLKRLSVADIMDAEMASERAVNTPAGVMLLRSDAKMGFELIRRSVLKIGDFECGLSLEQLRSLDEDDFKILSAAYKKLNKADAEAGLSEQGRDVSASS